MDYESVSRTGHSYLSHTQVYGALATSLYGSFSTLGLILIFVLLFSRTQNKSLRST